MTVERLIEEVSYWGDWRLTTSFLEAFDELVEHWSARSRDRGVREDDRLDKIKEYRKQLERFVDQLSRE